jgi:hypothetical protein
MQQKKIILMKVPEKRMMKWKTATRNKIPGLSTQLPVIWHILNCHICNENRTHHC